MTPDPLDSLTPSERLVLATLLAHRDQKAIARELALSPETVKTHLRNAREKTGIRTSFALARALAERDQHTPDWGMPRRGGGAGEPDADTSGEPGRPDAAGEVDGAFHEDRAIFDFEEPSFDLLRSPGAKGVGRPDPLIRLLLAAGLALLLVVIILMAVPLSDSFQHFANFLDPPKG